MNDNKQIPFNTGKVLIGSVYDSKVPSYPSREDEFWQSVLLGEYEARRIQRIQFICYLVLLVCVFAILCLTVGEK